MPAAQSAAAAQAATSSVITGSTNSTVIVDFDNVLYISIFMFFNLDEICLDLYGDAKAYENTGILTAVTNTCRGRVTSAYPGITINTIETYTNDNEELILKASILKHNKNE